jgi:hypothetical protein
MRVIIPSTKKGKMSKKEIINKLLSGEPIKGYKEGGNSMTPLIKHRQPVDLDPVDTSKLTKGDMVLVKVKGRIYTHKVTALRKNQVQIGNNHGGINGWTNLDNVYGIVTAVDGREITSAFKKVKKVEEVELDVVEETRDLISKAVIGLSLEDAKLEVEKVDWCFRIVRLDSQRFIVTADMRTNRVNLEVDDGIVSSAYIG